MMADMATASIIGRVTGGAGAPEDLYQALIAGKADAVLAASIFHYGTYSINDIKQYLDERGIPVRMQGG